MTGGAPRSHRQFRRVEARYGGGFDPKWYRADDLGALTPLVTAPVWVYATWAPFEVNAIGSRSDDYIVLVDNTYVSSFAFNMAKVELGARLFPDEDDYADLMIGNLKKFFAEQQYIQVRDGESMQWVLEYLIEHDGRNHALDARIRRLPDGPELLHVLSLCATRCLLLHELGHVAHDVGDYRFRQHEVIEGHIRAVVGGDASFDRLDEEAFCDIFAVINAMTLLNRENGWDPDGLRGACLHALLGAMMCIKTRDLVQAKFAGGPRMTLEPAQDALMARYEVTARAIREASLSERQWFDAPRRALPFAGDTLDLRARWLDALRMPVRDPRTRTLATIIAGAFCDPTLGGFDHVMRSLNQMSPLSHPPDPLSR